MPFPVPTNIPTHIKSPQSGCLDRPQRVPCGEECRVGQSTDKPRSANGYLKPGLQNTEEIFPNTDVDGLGLVASTIVKQ